MSTLRRRMYRLGERLHGWSVEACLAELQELRYWKAERLRDWQRRRLVELLSHAGSNVAFYRRLWDAHGAASEAVREIGDLTRLPTVRKDDLRQAGQDALDARQPPEAYLRDHSSGSTGRPFVHYKDREHHSWMIAGSILGWEWAGWRMGEPWIRLQHRGTLGFAKRLEDWALHCLHMPIDRFGTAFFDGFVERAVGFGPVMLRGYAGGTYVFARYLLERGETRLRPRVVVTTGDTLHAHYRAAIGAAFDCPIHDTYGGEGLHVANQCEHGRYHVLPTVLVELVGEGPRFEDGPSGRIVLTSLTNRAMPFVRYEIGDLGVAAAGDCPCGCVWPGLSRIVGRETDIVATPAGRHLICHHFDTLFREQSAIRHYQVVQDRIEAVVVRLAVGPEFDAAREVPKLERRIAELGGTGFAARIELVDDLPLPASGKRRYVISNVEAGTAPRRAAAVSGR